MKPSLIVHGGAGNIPDEVIDACKSGCERALGWPKGSFLTQYQANQQRVTSTLIEGDSVAATLQALMQRRERWEGTTTELLGALSAEAVGAGINTHSKAWPQSPRNLTARLDALKLIAEKLPGEVQQQERK